MHQEPGLLIIDPSVFARENTYSLLEWSPTVIVPEKVLNVVSHWGVKIDFVFSSRDQSNPLEEPILAQSPVKILKSKSEKMIFTDVLYFLMAGNRTALNVVVNPISNQKFIDDIENLPKSMEVVFYFDSFKCYQVRKRSFEKWAPKDRLFKVLKRNGVDKVNSYGLTQQMSCNPDTIDFITKEDGKIKIESKIDAFWVVEEI